MKTDTKFSVPSESKHGLDVLFRKARNLVSGILFDINGGLFRVDGCEFVTPKHISDIGWRGVNFGQGEYEASERKMVRKFVKPQDSVIELGVASESFLALRTSC